MKGHEDVALSCDRRGLHWVLGKISSVKMWLGIGTGYPGSDGITIPGSVLKVVSMAFGDMV